MTDRQWGEWLGPGLACLAAVIYLALVGAQLERPLMYDDANFALAARAIAETGLPFGNQGWMSERGDFSQREQWALWHPPLYIYVLGLVAKVGGWTPLLLRLPSIVAGLVTGYLTFVLASEWTRGPLAARRMAGGVAAALVLLSPVVVQSALILDIDLTLLLPLTLLFLLLYGRLESSAWRWLWLAPLFGVMLWAKMTNPLPVLTVAVVWQLLRGHPDRAGKHLVGIGVGGAALFGVTWLAVGSALGFPLDMPFSVNLVQWQDSADGARRAYTSPGAFIEGLQPTVLWLGPGLVAAGLAGVAVRCAELTRVWRFVRMDLLIGLAMLLAVGYVYKSAGWFAKYQVALAPLLACLAAPLVAQAWCARPRLTLGFIAASTAGAGLVHAQLIRDDWNLQRTWAIAPTAGVWLLVPVILCVLAAVPWRAAGTAAIATLVGVSLGWSLAAGLGHASAPYSTTYWFGTRGTAEATAWLNEHLTPEQTYVAPKEVALPSPNQRYVDQETLVFFLGAGLGFSGVWHDQPVQAVIAWEREPYVADLIARDLGPLGYRATARFGDYVVYERTG